MLGKYKDKDLTKRILTLKDLDRRRVPKKSGKSRLKPSKQDSQ